MGRKSAERGAKQEHTSKNVVSTGRFLDIFYLIIDIFYPIPYNMKGPGKKG